MDGVQVPGFKRYVRTYPTIDLGFKVKKWIPVDVVKLQDWYLELERKYSDWKFVYDTHKYMWIEDPCDPLCQTGHAFKPDTSWYTLCWNPPTDVGVKPPERGHAKPEYQDNGGQELFARECFNGYALDLVKGLPAPTTRWLVTIHTPGTKLITHQDASDKIRVHIPIHTNNNSTWIIDGEEFFMEPGWAYVVNTSLPHSVENKGNSDRIHLYGKLKVEEWLKIS